MGDVNEFQKQLAELLMNSVSSFDAVGENFFHGLVLGLCALLSEKYYISSNRESGEGRYDIALNPRGITLPGIIIELKWSKNCKDLKSLAKKALEQINERKYATEMLEKNVTNIIKYGIAFSGKNVEIEIE